MNDAEKAYQYFVIAVPENEEQAKAYFWARKALRFTLTPQNEWVAVEERLPEPDFPGQQRGFYLVALSNGTVKELMYEFRHYENMMFDVGWHETAYPVTHWMPLPTPPDRRPPEGEANG